MDISDKLFVLLYNTLRACVEQIVWLWGMLFVIGFALFFVSRFRNVIFSQTLGNKAELFLTSWIGTPVHEMGHAIFCVLFRHKITEAKFFSPQEDGTLGYIKHEFNPKSSFQKIGNFFIGVAPMIFGAVLIYALLGLLLPQYLPEVEVSEGADVIGGIAGTGWQFFKNLLSTDNFSNWRFWVFLYLSLGISSNMTLSRGDFKGAASGFVTLLCLIFLVNLTANALLSFGLKSLSVSAYLAAHANIYLSLFYSITLYALVISIVYFAIAYLLLGLLNLARGRGWVRLF